MNGIKARKEIRLREITETDEFKALQKRLKQAFQMGYDGFTANLNDDFIAVNNQGKIRPKFECNDSEDIEVKKDYTDAVLSLLQSSDEDYGGWVIDLNVNDPLRPTKKTFSITQAFETDVFGLVKIKWNAPNEVNSALLTADILNASIEGVTNIPAGTFEYKCNGQVVTVGDSLQEGVNKLLVTFTPTSNTFSKTKKRQTINFVNLP